MTGINKIDYSLWSNNDKNIAEKVDKDNIKGLNGKEVFDFAKTAYEENYEIDNIYSLLGMSISNTCQAIAPAKVSKKTAAKISKQNNPKFDKAAEYYNKTMTYFQKNEVTTNAFENVQARLFNMEKDIDNALLNCQAYQDIMIVPRSYYKYYPKYYYPTWDEKLINFDIDEIRTTTTKDMASLNKLRNDVESAIETANGGIEKCTAPQVDYDVDKIAEKHLGMSYKEFAEKYKTELEFCKNVTSSDTTKMTDTQKEVYTKAKAYAKEMIQTTVLEAHNANWDIGERKTEESIKASGDMYSIIDFESNDITEEGISNLKSGIMYKAFEEALISKYDELTTEIKDAQAENKKKGTTKKLVNNHVEIEHPDGVYDTVGRKIK